MSASVDTVHELRKHPLAVKALEVLSSQNAPLHLQGIAARLNVHKVSAHRAMSRLIDLKLVQVRGGSDARYRYFAIPESKEQLVRQLVGATKRATHIPIGRAVVSVMLAVEDEVRQGLKEKGLQVGLASKICPYDILIQAGKATVGIDVKMVTDSFSQTRFNEIVGSIMTSIFRLNEQPTFLVVVLIGVGKKELVEMGRRVETHLREGFGLNVKFLWVSVQPLDLDSKAINKAIVEPIMRILNEWQLK